MQVFESLAKPKKQAILNAGYACFGRNGYKKTSMADIAETAGVSKASLFHYFGSKLRYYTYLYHFGARTVIDALDHEGSLTSDDFFTRIRGTQALKMGVVADYPNMYDFYVTSVSETDTEAVQSVQDTYNRYIKDGYAALFNGVDWNRFKPDVDIEQVMNLITWVSEGYVKSAIQTKNRQQMQAEMFSYLGLIQKAVYREEYL